MNKDIKPYANTCVVELELPWEVAELLVEQGPSLIEEISVALRMRRQRTEYNRKFASLQEQDRQENRKNFHNLGRIVEEELQGNHANKTAILRKLSVKYDVSRGFLESVRNVYLEQQKEERVSNIVRFYFQGFSNEEIGKRVGMAPNSVGRILKEQGDLISALRRIMAKELRTQGGAK